MTWSKVSTTTNGFVFDDTSTASNTTSADGTAPIEELLAFMETRGWVTSVDDAYGDGSLFIYRLRKTFVCTDGGSQEVGFIWYYNEGLKSFKGWPWNPGTDERSTGSDYWDISTAASGPSDVCSGKWSFWTSDADTDSFLIIAEETTNDHIIGFWPPSGSLFRQGYGGGTYGFLKAGCKAFWLNDRPSWETDASDLTANFADLHVDNSYRAQLSTVSKKFDYCWVANEKGRPLFRQFAGDIHQMVNLGSDGTTEITNIHSAMDPTAVYEIGSDYWIVWGDTGPKLLFNCGGTAPVF